MWSKVKTRLLSAVVLIALVILALFFAPPWGVALLVFGVIYAVMYELTKVFNLGKKHALTTANFVFATLFLVFPGIFSYTLLPLLIVLYIVTLMSIAVIDNQRVSFSDVCASVFMLIYALFTLSHLIFIRVMENGVALLVLALLGAYVTDTGAYFVGLTIGKHKLIERVSPNKTIEGALGGVAFTVLAFVIYGFVMKHSGHTVNFLYLLILSVLCAVVAQLGDLSASLMKRSFAVKDFGNIIPGHGGIVDRVDSLMFVAPLVYYFITFLPVIK